MKDDDQIGSYRLIERLDEGTGPGEWRGRSVDDASLANLRIVDVGDGEANFVDHLTRVHALEHSRIHRIAAFGVHEGRFGWVATSASSGTTLALRMAQGPMPYSEAVAAVGDVLEALVVAHEAGVHHGALEASAVAHTGDHWVLSNLGLSDLAPGAVWAGPGDDLKAVKALLRQLVPSPPPPLRALLASGPSTAAAFLRALKILPVHDGRAAHRPGVAATPPAQHSAPVTGADWVDPVAPTQERPVLGQPKAASTPPAADGGDVLEPLDTWGVPPQSGPSSWVDRDRQLIKTSSASAGSSEASWGVRGDGPNLVTNERPSSFGPSQKMALAVFLALVAGGALFFRFSSERAPAGDFEETEANRAEGAAADQAEGDAAVQTDAGRPEGVVDVTFSPGPVRVVRTRDGVVVCDDVRVCRLPIDVDYRAERPGYKPLHVSGDDLYDRRNLGRWRLVLSPEPEPEPRRKRRRPRPPQ